MKKNKIELHTCKECLNAYLMRSTPYNPIVCECDITEERYVAVTPFECKYFKPNMREVEIHPMIKYDKAR